MKTGDLVRWSGRTSVKFPGPRFGIVIHKEAVTGPESGNCFWRILFEGKTVRADERYWKVVSEDR